MDTKKITDIAAEELAAKKKEQMVAIAVWLLQDKEKYTRMIEEIDAELSSLDKGIMPVKYRNHGY